MTRSEQEKYSKTTCNDAALQPQHVYIRVVLVAATRLDPLPQSEQLIPHTFVTSQLQRLKPSIPFLRRVCRQLLRQTALENCKIKFALLYSIERASHRARCKIFIQKSIRLTYTEAKTYLRRRLVHSEAAMLQYYNTQRLRPLFSRFKIEQKIPAEPAPTFRTRCTTDRDENNKKFYLNNRLIRL